MHYSYKSILILIIITFLGCDSSTTIKETSSNSSDFEWDLPEGVFAPRVPDSNPITKQKVELGRYLFYDKRLSANQKQSCSSCHFQKYAFADKNTVGIGSTGVHGLRNPNSLTNTAYYTSYSWANPALGTLERFIIIPITGDDPVEMGVFPEYEEEVLVRFENNETYQQMFTDAYPDVENPFTLEYIVKALASFNRVLNSYNSPYDKYLRGDSTALSESQKRGMNIFMNEEGECFHCHEGINFSDSTANVQSFYVNQFFHNIGLYNIGGDGSYTNLNQGLYESTMNEYDKGKFKAPSLRNVELTSPYMHDGSMATLADVIELHSNGGRNITSGEYAGDGRNNPFKSDLIVANNFSDQNKEDLVEFLKALTDNDFITNPNLSNPFKEEE